jgi:CBS domain-containing protein
MVHIVPLHAASSRHSRRGSLPYSHTKPLRLHDDPAAGSVAGQGDGGSGVSEMTSPAGESEPLSPPETTAPPHAVSSAKNGTRAMIAFGDLMVVLVSTNDASAVHAARAEAASDAARARTRSKCARNAVLFAWRVGCTSLRAARRRLNEASAMERPNTVGEIMTRKVAVLHEEDNLLELDRAMELLKFRHLPVVDGNRLVGVVSQRDVLRMSVSALSPTRVSAQLDAAQKERTFVANVMTRDPISARAETPLAEAARTLADKKVGCLPVVDAEGMLVGIVTDHDFLRLASQLLANKS